MKRVFSILLILLSLSTYGQLNNLGTPFIYNYTKSDYHAGTQNWGISQDENGFIYFANNEGVLIFDGQRWNQIQFSHSKPIRSVLVDSKNTVYIGLLNDFGIIEQNSNDVGSFKSLRYLLPPEIDDFDEIWRIYEFREGIIFQSFEYIFFFKGDSIRTIKPKDKFHFSFQPDDRYFFQEPGTGLYEYIDKLVVEVPLSNNFKDKEIIEILEVQNHYLLICTKDDGIYKNDNKKLTKWNTPVSKFLEKEKLFCAIRLKENHFAFGTILNGVVISDSEGNIIQHINKSNGLQNNTVLSMFSDRDDHLWLGLDNGIDFIEINSPIRYISDFEDIGTGYCAMFFKGKMYLGTNQGLFVQSSDNSSNSGKEFELVKNTAGQVWSLDIFNGQLICSHNAGTFLFENSDARKISKEEGSWRYIPLIGHQELIIGGHYNGLVLLKDTEEGWRFEKKIKGFNESCRFIRQSENGDLWVSHGAKGIFRIRLNPAVDSVTEYKLYTSNEGLPSNERNIVFKFNKEVFISTIKGIYIYNEERDSFEYSDRLNHIFDVDGRLKTFTLNSEGNIWFIAQNESGVLRLNEDNTYTKIVSPFKNLDEKYVNEFESIYQYNPDHIFIGIYNGFAHYSSVQTKSYNESYKTFITQVELPYLDSSIYFNQLNKKTETYHFPFKNNSFRFHFTSPFYENHEELQFSFLLKNFSEEWSEWVNINFKDYTNLTDGEYFFRVKAKNIYDIESSGASFHFIIDPPYYKTALAYYIYIFLFLLLLFAVSRIIYVQVKKSKIKSENKHKLEIIKREEEFKHQSLIAEKEIIRLRNEKLRSEMLYKDKELANQTMNIIQKNKFLIKLREELSVLLKSTLDPQLKAKLVVISRRLDKEIDNKQQNKVFKTYFEEVHEEFFKRVREIHPELSPRDLHLCAYIKMNLSTKEISSLLNITNRGVEISRYRLRKKLNISREVNLSTYLSNI